MLHLVRVEVSVEAAEVTVEVTAEAQNADLKQTKRSNIYKSYMKKAAFTAAFFYLLLHDIY